MGKKKVVGLLSRNQRSCVGVGERPQERLAEGWYLTYRRSRKPDKGGAWGCKLYDPETQKSKKRPVGVADDVDDADGVRILNHDQAVEAAKVILKRMAREADLIAGGEEIYTGPYTVAHAWADYIADAERRGVKGVKIMQQTYDAHIAPELGSVQVSKLSTPRITRWHQGLAEKGKRKTGKAREKAVHMDAPKTEEEKRKRRDSANRILTNLKSALNFALAAGKVQEPAPWHQVKPFPNTSSSRVRFLSLEEQQKLVAGCDPILKPLVLVGLYTGARYSELTPVLVRDFDPLNGTLYLAFGKGKGGTKPRTVTLSDEGTAFLKEFTQGRGAGELMFKRIEVKRRSRKTSLADPNQWASYDQSDPLDDACEASGVDRVTFHELRHTYASYLLNSGVQLSYLAAQLGHADLRMVTKYYGHLAKTDMIKAIRAVPSPGLT